MAKRNLNHTDKAALPKFPLEVFPSWLQDFIKAYNQEAQFPISFTASSVLSAIAGAMGKGFYLNAGNGRIEYPILYMLLVGPDGARKSPPMKLALNPLNYLNDKAIGEYNEAMKFWKDGEERPKNGQFLFGDVTFESLIDVIKSNSGAYVHFYDEIKTLFDKLKKDNDSFGISDLLSFWNGGDYLKNRRSDNSVTSIKNIVPNVLGSTQLGTLPTCFTKEIKTTGFMQRWLFAVEQDRVFTDFNKKSTIDPKINDQYAAFLHKIAGYRNNGKQLLMSADADKELRIWGNAHNEKRKKADSPLIDGIYGKLEYAYYRLCLIMQILRFVDNNGNNEEISKEAAQSAAKLVEFYRSQAEYVCEFMDESAKMSNLTTNDKRMFPFLPQTFTYAAGYDIVAERVNISESSYQRALGRLRDAGLIEKYSTKSGIQYERQRKRI